MSKTFHELVAEQRPTVECQEMNAAYWFADEHDEDEPFGRSEKALAVSACRRCPLMSECLEYALENNITYGVWGAMVPGQREHIRVRREMDAKQSSA